MHYFVFAILSFASTVVNAQVNLDSLWGVWQNPNVADSSRVDALTIVISKRYLREKPDSAYLLAGDGINLLDKQSEYKRLSSLHHYQGLSFAYRRMDDEALPLFEKAVQFAKMANDDRTVARSLNSVGSCHFNLSDFQASLDYYALALELSRKIGDKKIESTCLSNLANSFLKLGNYSESAKVAEQAVLIREILNDVQNLPGSLGNLGNAYFQLGDIEKAISAYNRMIEISTTTGNQGSLANGLNSLGTMFQRLNKYDEALDKFQDAMTIHRELENWHGLSTVLMNIGTTYADMKDDGMLLGYDDSAISYYKESLKISEELGDAAAIVRVLNNIGIFYFYQKRDYDTAIVYHRKALDGALKIDFSFEIGEAYQNLFINYYAQGEMDRASESLIPLMRLRLEELRVNFPVQSEAEKEKYFAQIAVDFQFLDLLALEQNDRELLAKSYDNSLMLKGLLLKSSTAMRNAILSSGDTATIQKYEAWIDLKKEISKKYAAAADYSELERQADIIEKELSARSNEFLAIHNIQRLTWKEVQANLSDDEAAIEFLRVESARDNHLDTFDLTYYCALIVRKNSPYPEIIRLFEENEIKKILGSFPGNNLTYIDQVYGTSQNAKTQLYDLIWKPMEKSLEGISKVYISPVGLLHKISFSALAKKQDIFLCDLFEVESQSTTGGIALSTQQSSLALRQLTTTLFGGIDYNSDSTSYQVDGSPVWRYLDGSLAETEKINTLLEKNGQNVTYYNLASATEAQFKRAASNSNILHIATHGFFYPDPEEIRAETIVETETDYTFRGGTSGFGVRCFVKNKSPLMRSGLVFAGANDVWSRSSATDDSDNSDSTYTEDGVLTAAEVATIDMRNTELVVLSACETGLGDIKGSEGVYGLQRAFKMAGVKYIIMSLWQVPDKETAEFMTTFYKNLTKTNDIRKSFNLTQQTMRKKYDPYYWGAFTLIE